MFENLGSLLYVYLILNIGTQVGLWSILKALREDKPFKPYWAALIALFVMGVIVLIQIVQSQQEAVVAPMVDDSIEDWVVLTFFPFFYAIVFCFGFVLLQRAWKAWNR